MIKDQITLLKQYINTLESENQARNRQRETLQKQIDSLLKQNQYLHNLLKSNNNNYTVSQSERTLIETEIRIKYQNQVFILKKEITQIKIQHESQLSTLKKQLEQYKNLEFKSINTKDNEIKRMQQQLARTKKEIQAGHEVNKLKNQNITMKSQWDAQKRNLEYQIQNLRNDKINKSQIDNSVILKNQLLNFKRDYQIQKSKWQSKNYEFEREKTSLQQQLNRANYESNQKSSQILNIKRQLVIKQNQWSSQRDKLNIQINNFKTQIYNLQTQLTTSKSETIIKYKNDIQKLTNEISILKQNQQSSETKIINLSNEIERLLKLNEDRKNSSYQISNFKQNYNNILITNTNLQNQINILKQNQIQFDFHRNEFINLLTLNKNLEKRILILENSNQNLSEELSKNISNSRLSINKDQVIQSLKNQLTEYKKINEQLTKLNNQLTFLLQSKKDLLYNTTQTKFTNQFSNTDDFIQKRRSQKKDKSKHHSLVKTVSPIYNAPAKQKNVYDKSKWDYLQKKINALKSQNQQLKNNLTFGGI